MSTLRPCRPPAWPNRLGLLTSLCAAKREAGTTQPLLCFWDAATSAVNSNAQRQLRSRECGYEPASGRVNLAEAWVEYRNLEIVGNSTNGGFLRGNVVLERHHTSQRLRFGERRARCGRANLRRKLVLTPESDTWGSQGRWETQFLLGTS